MPEHNCFLSKFIETKNEFPKRLVLQDEEAGWELSYEELYQKAVKFALYLSSQGLMPEDRVALIIGNRIEFYIADLAVLMLGAVPFSIYFSSAPDQISYLFKDSEARHAIVETAFMGSLKRAQVDLDFLLELGPDKLDISNLGGDQQQDIDAFVPARSRMQDLACLIYTSGTTGPPKGVELTHANIDAMITMLEKAFQLPNNWHTISWLPNAHTGNRLPHYWVPLSQGWTVTCCSNRKNITQIIKSVRPNWLFSPPLLFERLMTRLRVWIDDQEEEIKTNLNSAFLMAKECVLLQQNGKALTVDQMQERKLAQKYLDILREHIGFSRMQVAMTGAAPVNPDLVASYLALGVELGEAWGMSELTGLATVQPMGHVKLRTAGKPLIGVNIRIAEDGEIEVKGPNLMRGYRNRIEKTKETIDGNGWLRSGDLGVITDDGYLQIIGRKKEMIINSAGKNMSPLNIEAAIKDENPLIRHFCVIGNDRPYNVALCVLDVELMNQWAEQNGLKGASFKELSTNETLLMLVEAVRIEGNRKLSRIEQVKKIKVLDHDWVPGGDELTPTMKLMRNKISNTYSGIIEDLYKPLKSIL